MQRKRRDNRTRMQRKADQSAAIAAFCLFFCAVLAFCVGVCKITAPKLKPQESALKCEIDVCEESKEKYVDGSLPGDDTPATLCAYIEYEIPAYNLSEADSSVLVLDKTTAVERLDQYATLTTSPAETSWDVTT